MFHRSFSRTFLPIAALLLVACGKEEKPAAVIKPAGGCSAAVEAVSSASLRSGQRFLVKLKNSPGRMRALRSLAREGNTEALAPDLLRVNTDQETNAAELKERFGEGEVAYVEPDYPLQADAMDPDLVRQWAHTKVDSAGAWEISRGSRDVVVAILDSGVDYRHSDLAENMWKNEDEIPGNKIDDDENGYVDDVYGWNFVSDNNKPLDDNGHGTHVAGTVGAVGENGVGISGHSPRVRLMALRFLDSNGSGLTSDAIRGIDYAIKHGARIINNSWGSSDRSQALGEAIERARAAGVLVVAAAGNSGQNNDRRPHFPSNYPHDNIVRVGASDGADALASFSNYGTGSVDLVAPGVKIYSTQPGGLYQYLSGTSMATPLVSGVLATMLADRPDLNYRQIRGALLDSVDPFESLRSKVTTGGRVNAGRALTLLHSVGPDWVPNVRPAFRGCL